jgi:hypothetical protein
MESIADSQSSVTQFLYRLRNEKIKFVLSKSLFEGPIGQSPDRGMGQRLLFTDPCGIWICVCAVQRIDPGMAVR